MRNLNIQVLYISRLKNKKMSKFEKGYYWKIMYLNVKISKCNVRKLNVRKKNILLRADI